MNPWKVNKVAEHILACWPILMPLLVALLIALVRLCHRVVSVG